MNQMLSLLLQGQMREMQARQPISHAIVVSGEQLVSSQHYAALDLKQRLNSLRDKWQRLNELTGARRTLLDDALESHQYYADANEAESWMKEKMPLVCSEDYGNDEPSAKVE